MPRVFKLCQGAEERAIQASLIVVVFFGVFIL
jgi:hypothetical protein